MKTLEELRKYHAELIKQADDIKAKLDNPEISSEDQSAFDKELVEVADKLEMSALDIKQAEGRKATLDKIHSMNKVERKTAPKNEPVVEHVKDNIMDDPKLGFQSLGDLGLAVANVATSSVYDSRLDILGAADGLNQGTPSKGGFLVPPQFRAEIWAGAQNSSLNLWDQTDNYNIEGESLTFPAVDETSRATGSRWGGVRAYWAAEAAQMTDSDPKFRQAKLEPNELHVLTYATNKLLRKSPTNLSQFLTRAATDELNFALSNSVLNGTGAGQPQGIMNSGALVSIAKESGQAASSVVVANINKMYNRMPAQWLDGAVWLVHRTVLPQLEEMSLASGSTPLYLPGGMMVDAPFGRLKGLPVIRTEYNQVLGTQGDVILVNLKAYFSGQSGMTQSDRSIHFKFDTNQEAFRWIVDADGQTWMQQAITEFNGSDKISPYITLDTRA